MYPQFKATQTQKQIRSSRPREAYGQIHRDSDIVHLMLKPVCVRFRRVQRTLWRSRTSGMTGEGCRRRPQSGGLKVSLCVCVRVPSRYPCVTSHSVEGE